VFSNAEAYERFMGRWSRLLAPAFVSFAEVASREHVLDVGSGTGALSHGVVDAIAGASVIGIDASEELVAYAIGQNAGRRAQFVVGNARELPFEAATFHRTLSMLVLNFVPAPERAVDEMIRVTRPGGTVACAVWDYADGMQMLRVFWDEAGALDPTVKARDEAHMPLCKESELAALWKDKQLEDVRTAPLVVALRFASFDDYWRPFLLGQGPAGAHAKKLSEGERRALEQRLRARLLARDVDGPIELRARAWAVRGRI
jgi:SAM-dependent methyltransferase